MIVDTAAISLSAVNIPPSEVNRTKINPLRDLEM